MSRTRVEILAQNVDIESTLALKDGGTTRLYIDSSGNLAIGNNTSPGGALDVTGNIVVSGTVDGRDIAVDGAKLDAIEAGATADQTAAEIKTAYESNADTNAFTNAEQTKLSGIATGAQVNVNADWNATTGDAVILNKPSIPTDNAQLTNGAGYITSFDITTQTDPKYLRSDSSDSYTGAQLSFTNTGVSTMHWGGQGWQVSNTDAAYQRVDARDDGTNYARMHWYGVSDSGSTSNFRHAWYDGANYFNVTASSNAINFARGGVGELQVDGNKVWNAGNDGSATGLDADMLDGYHLSGADSVSTKIFNNKGLAHNSLTNFDSNLKPGPNYINGGTNGPTGSGQWYGFMLGLGSEYNTTPGNNNGYASQFYWGRQNQTSNNPYLWVRDMETGSWGSWRKMSAGAADTATTATTLDPGTAYQTSQSTTAKNRTYGMEIDFVRSNEGWPSYGTVVTAKSYSDGGGTFQLYNGYGSAYGGNNLRYRTADYSASSSDPPWTSWRQIWDAGNDGSGSGLDADTLDGVQASGFLVSTSDSEQTGNFGDLVLNQGAIWIKSDPRANEPSYNSNLMNMHWYASTSTGGNYGQVGHALYNGSAYQYLHTVSGQSHLYINNNKVWNAGNDGSGSGLDADTLDGYHGSNFIGKNGNSYYRPDTWIDFRSQVGLYWGGGTGAGWHFYPGSTSSMIVRSGASGAVDLNFQTAGTTRGYVYANNSNEIGFLNSSGSWSLKVDNSGNTTATGNVTAYSDIRLKSDIEPITDALDKVSQINGVTFTRVDSGERQAGVIAQDVEKVLPEVVRDGEDYKSVAYGNMVGLLVEAIKEQQATIQKLTERIEVLEGGN